LGNTLEAVGGAWLLQRVACFHPSLERLKDVLGLIGVAAIATMVSATVGVASLFYLGTRSPDAGFGSLWYVWWMGDAMGALLAAPAVLTWATQSRFPWPRLKAVEAVCVLALLIATNLVVFTDRFPDFATESPLRFLVFPCLIWGAIRVGPPLTAVSIVVTAGISIWGTIHNFGPFSRGSPQENLILLQSFLSVISMTALLLSAAVADGRHRADQLADADRRKDAFLAMLAHELRNPLAPLSNALEILRRKCSAHPELERIQEMMERQLRQLVRLVDDLLEVSRITRGKITLRRQHIDLASVVESAVETSRPLIEAGGHKLTVTLPSTSLVLDADPIRLAQVMANLLNNAAKYTEAGGQIWLSARRERAEAVVSVRDTGVGIAPEMLPHIFDMFTQVDRSTVRSQSGLGIGLALVRSLVMMHGGSVNAASAGLGKGSEFTVRLPLLRGGQVDKSGEGSGAANVTVGATPIRILVVDDNRDAADSIGMILSMQGHDVKIVYDGPSALEAASVHMPSVVLLDIGMPGMDGLEVARRLRARPELEGTIFIALTGWGKDEDRRQSQEAGFQHHLIKPLEPSILQNILATLGKDQ